MANVAHLCEIV